MKRRIILVALGGNALFPEGGKGTVEEQEAIAKRTCEQLLPLIATGDPIVITHGNGPQVGRVLLRNELLRDQIPPAPLDVCVGSTEGTMGYILQQALLNELRRNSVERYVVTMITQVIVGRDDPAFQNPTKPIGPFFEKDKADALQVERGWAMVEDAGRGYRRVVPSPKPERIIQSKMIRRLAVVGHVVIALGGGGIPIRRSESGDYVGVEAVIDKDLASALLASQIKADIFIILTRVPHASLNYGKPDERPIGEIQPRVLRRYIRQGHFQAGSMLPKVEAALNYLSGRRGLSIITRAEDLQEALAGRAGTRIRH
ncbi:MAG: carbamate kinase [Planctomycetota bacterium]|nr:carbamate kinase [Planctomycetota bacterium]